MQRQHLEQIAAAAAAAAVHHSSPPPGAMMGGGPQQMPRDPMLSLAASMVPPPVPIFSHPGGAPPPLSQHHALAAAAAAFPTSTALQNSISSASSHSSESSNSSQQTWSFEEQFKQVRQASRFLVARMHWPFRLYRYSSSKSLKKKSKSSILKVMTLLRLFIDMIKKIAIFFYLNFLRGLFTESNSLKLLFNFIN